MNMTDIVDLTKEEVPLKYLLMEYKMKFRLAKAMIIFLVTIFFITMLFVGFAIKVTGDTQYKLGETIGITETVRFLLNQAQPSARQSHSIQLNTQEEVI